MVDPLEASVNSSLERLADSLALAASAFDHGRELAVGIILEYAVLERSLGLRITGQHGRHVNQAASTRVLGSELDECVDRGCVELAYPVLPVLEEFRLGLDVRALHFELVILGVSQDVVDLLDQRIDLGTARRCAFPPLGHERGNALVVRGGLVQLEDQLVPRFRGFLALLDIFLDVCLIVDFGAIKRRHLDRVDVLEDVAGWPVGPESQGG